ncbi:MAG: hypothetical protein KJO65_06945 [Gemmatimonadetes bacterium]|nr:hypothetical protein [Gemmatimonadota bacterium]
MGTALKIVALFAVYSGIAYVGDLAVGLLANEPVPAVADAAPTPDDERAVVVEVRPEIVTRVQVRRSDGCDYALDREMTLSAADVALVDIRAGSGELHIEGEDGLDEIVVVGRVCASEESFIDELTISGESANGTAVIQTHYPDNRGWSGRRTARIDLVVLVPAGMAVDVEDSSGDMEVRRTGNLRIDDSSGGISVSDLRGSLEIDDSSGGLDVDGVEGDVLIEDGSGGLDIRGVAGSVVLRDGSGGIDIVGVGGDVIIEEDGSGGIDVRDVGRNLEVRRDGSGGIRHSGVQGTVDVPEKRRRGR